ncbi:conserved hypothetical protein [Candidatus Magnetomoraceae bacterium gMMP-1]
MKYYKTIIICLLFILIQNTTGLAVEKALRITDREIIEKLTELKSGQETINVRLEQVDKRFEELRSDVNVRFEQVDKRFEEFRLDMNTRFEQVDKRFEQVDKRFEELRSDMNARFEQLFNLMLWGFGILFTGIFGLIGFVIWDRKKSTEQVKEEVKNLNLDENPQLTEQIKQLIKNEINKLLVSKTSLKDFSEPVHSGV